TRPGLRVHGTWGTPGRAAVRVRRSDHAYARAPLALAGEGVKYRKRLPGARHQARFHGGTACIVCSSAAAGLPGASSRSTKAAYAFASAWIKIRSNRASSAARFAASRMKSVRLVPRTAAARSIRLRSSARMRMLSVVRLAALALLLLRIVA